MQPMSDLSDYRLDGIIVNIQSNGLINTVTQDGIPIMKLCGTWLKLKHVAQLKHAHIRKQFNENNFSRSFIPYIKFNMVIIGNNGEVIASHPIPDSQVMLISSYLKTK
jgi:hypothetical protein